MRSIKSANHPELDSRRSSSILEINYLRPLSQANSNQTNFKLPPHRVLSCRNGVNAGGVTQIRQAVDLLCGGV
jgi:hypothetical protein